ncbi:MAG: hypothetical protein Q8M58_02850, partial [Anaerolineales bacterium]|nr:hypothetical protein [Anaerolineales bacterium]
PNPLLKNKEGAFTPTTLSSSQREPGYSSVSPSVSGRAFLFSPSVSGRAFPFSPPILGGAGGGKLSFQFRQNPFTNCIQVLINIRIQKAKHPNIEPVHIYCLNV